MSEVVITGLSDNSKVPGFYAETLFAQSAIRLSSVALKCMLVGQKTSGGTLTADMGVQRIFSKEDADTYCGAGSELARMCYAALDEVVGLDGFELWVAAPAAAGGAAAASATITVTGTASANGTIYVWVGGDRVEVPILNGDVQNTIATKIDTAIKATTNYARFAYTSGAATNVVTATIKSAGARGNYYIVAVDFTSAPGVTLALGGAGSAITTGSTTILMRTFGGGTGVETLTNIQAVLFSQWHQFYGIAQNDATSLASWELQFDAKAAPTQGSWEHAVVASNGTFAATTSLAQTTLNHARFTMKHLENSETHPSEIAAAIACLRASSGGEQGSPNKDYDGYVYRTIRAQRVVSNWYSTYAAKQAALDVGVSPLLSRTDGKVEEVRSITTRCMNGSTPDYRCLDTAQAYVPDYVRWRLQIVYLTEVRPAMPRVAPNEAEGEKARRPNVLTPKRWASRANRELLAMGDEQGGEGILTQVRLVPATADYNYAADRVMSIVPCIPAPTNHAIGVSVRQLNTQAA